MVDPTMLELVASFDKRPKEVKAFLDRFVMQQHDASEPLPATCRWRNHYEKCEERQDDWHWG